MLLSRDFLRNIMATSPFHNKINLFMSQGFPIISQPSILEKSIFNEILIVFDCGVTCNVFLDFSSFDVRIIALFWLSMP